MDYTISKELEPLAKEARKYPKARNYFELLQQKYPKLFGEREIQIVKTGKPAFVHKLRLRDLTQEKAIIEVPKDYPLLQLGKKAMKNVLLHEQGHLFWSKSHNLLPFAWRNEYKNIIKREGFLRRAYFLLPKGKIIPKYGRIKDFTIVVKSIPDDFAEAFRRYYTEHKELLAESPARFHFIRRIFDKSFYSQAVKKLLNNK